MSLLWLFRKFVDPIEHRQEELDRQRKLTVRPADPSPGTGDDGKRTLWRSDGTTAGTRRVTSGPSAPVNPEAFSVINGRLYFSAADQSAASGRELWFSDGTAVGTRMLQDLNPGPTSSNPRGMVKIGDRKEVYR